MSLVSPLALSINIWILAGHILNITCNFLYCNHQVYRDFFDHSVLQTAHFIWVLACGELFKARQIHASAALSEGEDTVPGYSYVY